MNKPKQSTLKNLGIVLAGGLVILSWWLGWFYIIFYLLGLYAAVYIVSYAFRTTAIITFLLSVGGVILYVASFIVGIYLLYLILKIIFTGTLWYGLLLLFILGIFGGILQFIPMAIGYVLAYPLIFMSEDIEKRVNSNQNNI
jgi:hypothetical protein